MDRRWLFLIFAGVFMINFISAESTNLSDSGGLETTANVTLGHMITFLAFGGIIDNLIDGWITITSGLNVLGAIKSTDWGNVSITQSQITDFQGLDNDTSFGGDVSGTYNNLQLAADSVGDNEINYSQVEIGDFNNDVGYLTSYSETDPLWTANESLMAHTNTNEFFEANVTIGNTLILNKTGTVTEFSSGYGICVNSTGFIFIGDLSGATGC